MSGVFTGDALTEVGVEDTGTALLLPPALVTTLLKLSAVVDFFACEKVEIASFLLSLTSISSSSSASLQRRRLTAPRTDFSDDAVDEVGEELATEVGSLPTLLGGNGGVEQADVASVCGSRGAAANSGVSVACANGDISKESCCDL